MAITEAEAQALVRAHQAGDERAFEEIVRTQYQALYAHAYKRLSNHESAEDAVQDTLLRAYRALPNLDGDLRLQAWLHRILTNVCHDEGNRRMRQAGLIDKITAQPEELAPDPAEEVGVFDTVRLMADALDQLPESYREALVLRYVDGLSFREVGEVVGVSEENARARVHRGRLALRSIMSKVALVLAFLVPGLKRAQQAKESADAATASVLPAAEPAVTLTTQLTSHVVQAAPAVSRMAEMASTFPGGKSALVTTAVAAVAAVSVPVAATVHEVTTSPSKPASVSAPPTTEFTNRSGQVKGATAGAADVVARGATTTTASTLPPSLANPFQEAPFPGADGTTSGSTTSTTSTTVPSSSTSTSTSTTIATGPVIEGATKSDNLLATKTGPQYDLTGPIAVMTSTSTRTGRLEGRLALAADGTADANGMSITMADDKVLELRITGNWVARTSSDGTTSYSITGRYAFNGAEAYGLARIGDISATFRYSDKGTASLITELKGRAGS